MLCRQALPLAIALALTAPLLAHGADGSDEDELALVYGDRLTVSIATGSQLALRRAPAVATVITAEDIKAMGAVDLDQVIESVPGIHVSRTPNSWTPLYVVRGIYSQYNAQTLMLLNGIPMTTLFVGNKGNIWGGYPVENIARIEILRGPGSALYGADAYAGVINIITKTANDIAGTQFGVQGGSFGSGAAWVLHGGMLGPVAIAAYADRSRTDGSKGLIQADAQSQNDAGAGTHASLAPGVVNTGYDAAQASVDLSMQQWRWRSSFKLVNDGGTGAGIASALDPAGREGSKRIASDLSWTDAQLTPFWGAGASFSYMYYNQFFDQVLQLFPPGVKFPTGVFPNGMLGAPFTWERQLRSAVYANYTGWDAHRVRVGAGYDDLNMYQTLEYKNFTFLPNGLPVPAGAVTAYTGALAFMEPQRRKVGYVYVQDEWQLGKDWALTAGLRRDHYSDFGNTTNPRAALVWDAALDVTAKLLYGQAFRAPSFNEEYSINNPVVRGNPDLQPETIRTLEAVVAWQARKDVKLNLNLFRYAMKDIIRTLPNTTPGTGATYFNTGGQTGHGLELEASWEATRALLLAANYSYQRSVDDNGADAGYAPHHHLFGRADWRFAQDWSAGAQLNRVAQRERAAGDRRAPVPDYTALDASLRLERGKDKWSFALTAQNLGNADIREPSLAPGTALPFDLPMPRRALQLQASYRL